MLIAVTKQNLLKVNKTKQDYRQNVIKTRVESWQEKALHGQFLKNIKGKVDMDKTWY